MSSEKAIGLLERLQESEERLRGLSDATFEAIFLSVKGVCIDANKAAERLLGFTHEEFIGIFGTDVITPEFKDVVKSNMLAGIEEPYEAAALRKDGSTFPCEIQARMTNFRGDTVRVTALRDITARKKVEMELAQHREHLEDLVESRTAELTKTHDRLVHSSRKAGMADIASSVIHSVGNALNTTKVSVHLLRVGISNSKFDGLTRAMRLVNENSDDLNGFFLSDPRGKKTIEYLTQLGGALAKKREDVLSLLERLEERIGHIESIIAAQQVYAAEGSFTEDCDLREVVSDAIQIHCAAISQTGGKLTHFFDELPRVTVDKQKLIHIMITLLSNAEQARDPERDDEHCICIRLRAELEHALIRVEDNGVGIPQEDLVRIFNDGFSTRGKGRGYGLHNSTNAAYSSGWTLTACSDGPGTGAAFELRIPLTS